ncbi:MAG: AAA family ATPase [Anaerolineae bacterium]|nr:AAA family ATPase [Anaerolineae bacterium]
MPDTSFAPRVLALVGMPGSGKSLCAQHLETRGFFQFRFGSIVTNEVQRRGLALTPQHEQEVREAFRAQDGMAAIALRALPILRAELERRRSIAIDGLYSFTEYELLQAEFRSTMVVVAVVADRALRYQRLTGREERPLTPEEALARDFAEIKNLEKGGPIAIADYTLLNNAAPGALLANLDALIESLGLKP